MTTNHIDQLAQWYADAERITDTNLPRAGDTLIFSSNAGRYAIEVEEDDWTPDIVMPGELARILARAPKPKPAWHDAVAVMAVTPGRPERRVFIRDDEPGWWGDADSSYETDELAHVTPLIEAKVTDGMVLNYLNHSWGAEERGADAFEAAEVHATRNALTAALGLETT